MTITDQNERFALGAAAEGAPGGAYLRDKIRIPAWYKTPEAIGFMVLAGIIILISTGLLIWKAKK